MVGKSFCDKKLSGEQTNKRQNKMNDELFETQLSRLILLFHIKYTTIFDIK